MGIKMSVLILAVLVLVGCVGKKKSLCIDIAEGGNAHIELGYVYDESSATVTGPARLSTMTDEANGNPCLVVPVVTS